MMNGKPQVLTSKFKVSYNLLLNLLDIGENNLLQFTNKSMITGDLNNQINELKSKMKILQIEIDNMKMYLDNVKTPKDVIIQYIQLNKDKKYAVNKKRKEIERQIQNIVDNFKFIETDKTSYENLLIKENEINHLKEQMELANSYLKTDVMKVLQILHEHKFIEGDCNDEQSIQLTLKGRFAAQLREIHCLVFTELFENNLFDKLNPIQLVALFSCFTNIKVNDELNDHVPKSMDDIINESVLYVSCLYNQFKDIELSREINSGNDYNIHYDLLGYVEKWCETENIEECKFILQEIGEKKQIFLGEFVKALLKINNISCEIEKIAEMVGNISLLNKLREIPKITLKYVVTNQSLYV